MVPAVTSTGQSKPICQDGNRNSIVCRQYSEVEFNLLNPYLQFALLVSLG